MNIKATAAVLRKINGPLMIEEIDVPTPIEGQVLVEVHYSGVCRSQLMEARGGRGEDRWLPHLLGHEGSGVVIEVGAGVSRFRPGDKVIMSWLRSKGMEAPGAKYSHCSQIINSGCITTFTTHSVVSENRLTPLPDGVPMDVAVLFGCALLTGTGMVLNELPPCDGDAVVVIGLGGIGFSALMALSQFKCLRIIAIDPTADKRALAKEFGATDVFDPAEENLSQKIIQLTSGGAHACYEAGGSVASIELGFSLIRKGGGKLLFASHPPQGESIKLEPHELISGKRIAGSWGGASNPEVDIPRLAAAYREGRFPLEKLISMVYRLEQINEALADLEVGKAFRPLIAMRP